MRYKHFSEKEVEGLKPFFVSRLDVAREWAGVPFVITSGKRDAENNPGVEDSAHLKGLAVDLRCQDSVNRYRILAGLFRAGFYRIGCYSLHIHVDADDEKPQRVVWLGDYK